MSAGVPLAPGAAAAVAALATINHYGRQLWPGWSVLSCPSVVALPAGGALATGFADPPLGFASLPGTEADGDPPVHYKPGAPPRAHVIVPGALAGGYHVAHLGEQAIPLVALAGERDGLANLGALVRGLFRAQVSLRIAADMNVFAGAAADELEGLMDTSARGLAFEDPAVREAAFLAECQQAYERYPETALLNNVLANLEGRLLHGRVVRDGFAEGAATEAGGRLSPAAAAGRALALVRRDRYGEMASPLIAYERRMELFEGLARYVELRLYAVLAAAARDQVQRLGDSEEATGADLEARARRLLTSRLGLLTQLNQRGWGAARRRFAHSGMGVAFLLDEVAPEWIGTLVGEHLSLDLLLEQVVGFEGGQADDELLEAARIRYGYYERLADERHWVRDVEGRRRTYVTAALDAPGTRIAVDVSALEDKSSWYDGESVQRVGESVLVHQRPGVFTYGDGSTFVEFRGVALVEDRRSRVLQMTVPGPKLVVYGDEEALPETRNAEFTEGLEIDLGPLKVRAKRGTVEHEGGALMIKLLA